MPAHCGAAPQCNPTNQTLVTHLHDGIAMRISDALTESGSDGVQVGRGAGSRGDGSGGRSAAKAEHLELEGGAACVEHQHLLGGCHQAVRRRGRVWKGRVKERGSDKVTGLRAEEPAGRWEQSSVLLPWTAASASETRPRPAPRQLSQRASAAVRPTGSGQIRLDRLVLHFQTTLQGRSHFSTHVLTLFCSQLHRPPPPPTDLLQAGTCKLPISDIVKSSPSCY